MSVQLLSTPDLYALLRPVTIAAHSRRALFVNWGGTFQCKPLLVFEPESEYQCELVVELAQREGVALRVVGAGHSPSDLACTNGFMLRATRMDRVLEVNVEERYVIAQGGVTLRALHAVLARHGLAMSNCGSISEQTLAGVVATASHGTGIEYGVLSTHVVALSMLLADGSRVRCSRTENADLFMASVCGLGATGMVLVVQMQVEPAFRLRERLVTVPFEKAMADLDVLVRSAEHTRFWWFPTADVLRCSYADRTTEAKAPAGSWCRRWWWDTLVGHHAVQLLLFVGRYVRHVNTLTANLAAWLVRAESVGVDDGHRIFNVDCRYAQHTTEWAIPYAHTEACLRDLRAWLRSERADPSGVRPHFPVEIRFSAADDIWLSPSYQRRTCWIGLVQYKPYGWNVPYRRYFEAYERIVAGYGGRPHWAKAHGVTAGELGSLYPRFADFVRVLERVDVRGLFRNEYVLRHVLGRAVHRRVFKARSAA